MPGCKWPGVLPENQIDDEAYHHANDGAILRGPACERPQQECAEHFAPGDRGDGEADLDDMAASLREDGKYEQHHCPHGGEDAREAGACSLLHLRMAWEIEID